MRCWAQLASNCAHIHPACCESEVGQGSTKGGVCVCVCTVSSGTSNGAMLQNMALPNFSREEVQILRLPALMCSCS